MDLPPRSSMVRGTIPDPAVMVVVDAFHDKNIGIHSTNHRDISSGHQHEDRGTHNNEGGGPHLLGLPWWDAAMTWR